jgi:tetratricopeptide (TPR) repeat protein
MWIRVVEPLDRHLADVRAEERACERRRTLLVECVTLLDPLAVEPLFVQAEAEYAQGSIRRAWGLYLEATRVQPDNKETWFRLGEFEYSALGCPRHALPHLERFTELDPQGPGGDVYNAALAAVNSGTPKC